jgi:hypothetical protein
VFAKSGSQYDGIVTKILSVIASESLHHILDQEYS